VNRQEIEKTANIFGVDPQWAMNARLTFLYQQLSDVQAYHHEINRKRSIVKDLVEIRLYSSIIDKLEKKSRGLQYNIDYLKNNKQSTSGVSDDQIQRARDYPIEELLGEVNRSRRYKCFFHEDEHPSASIKNNKLRCWVCSKSWNPIDLLIERDGLTFIDAVKFLAGK